MARRIRVNFPDKIINLYESYKDAIEQQNKKLIATWAAWQGLLPLRYADFRREKSSAIHPG